ncbi:hypothetical protein [uncultured Cohaesibacter sp.]|uniref:hypothetical protein n=1 Tax=uncultured Cohaesibacter sp. TaxID=1002546 RepID=UPI0029C6FA89|nr:hypothetical protein [uncultured Cohaesibacter sp.]
MSRACKHQSLVDDKICQISYCADCGKVHLALGNMTLHLDRDQFDQLASSLRRAEMQKQQIDRAGSLAKDGVASSKQFH